MLQVQRDKQTKLAQKSAITLRGSVQLLCEYLGRDRRVSTIMLVSSYDLPRIVTALAIASSITSRD